ncbi:DNA polymerase III subunit gamma/tau [Pseudoblastomonas halimionae]|uniref:DNA polymerase III subunit gamma/tau n=1 Tax=Alteriqipengyuania halimionae TaxID=1926630 RepID=A0A6I4U3U1_9SPHN|nr:DNA polymerase III subunit gamma/tau [Alteriqipengyuania halimionae]MXP09142.1 DNA polymerase III subunit gamma/tau [Alteriqipengyuania halimionae]
MGDSPDDTQGLPWETEADSDTPSAAELEAAGQNSMFGEPAPEPTPEPKPEPEPEPENAPVEQASPPPAEPSAPAPSPAPTAPPVVETAQPYRVLARKYRPQTFSELIGQDAMVQTLGNAIARDRLAHAFLMTGVRGVGKTSTARLIAKALNCVGPDGKGGPTIDPCGVCEPCVAISEGRHIDVIEMDAASHTGVDDVREIIEAVRYAAVSARYKIYIIDEVHMLSRNAFNALLKTLEEPPAHVKFLFATTEVEKVPITVLSRCQRFDLRRISTGLLQEHFAKICESEQVEAEDEALAMIAAAAEGSVRDGLSILDQAIAHADLAGKGTIAAAQVREMLGLADRTASRTLFDALLESDADTLLDEMDRQFALGVEPLAMLRAVMNFAHRATVAQVGGRVPDAASEEERAAIAGYAENIPTGQLHRLWQLLLKGYEEVRVAPDPLASAQMALLRVLHAADMPDPGELAKMIAEGGGTVPTAGGASSGPPGGTSASAPSETSQAAAPEWEALVDQVEASGELLAAQNMRGWVRVINIADGALTYALAPGFSGDLGPELRDALYKITGTRWQVELGEGEGAPSLKERAEAAAKAARRETLEQPLVKATLAAFPDAEVIDESVETGTGPTNWSKRA